jgi:NADH:ubiquinone oxidoreductase subunit E
MDSQPLESKAVIFLCGGKNCEKEGAEKVYENLRELAKESGKKDRTEIRRCECLGPCKKGPCAYAFPAGVLLTGIKPKHARKVLDAATGIESADQ